MTRRRKQVAGPVRDQPLAEPPRAASKVPFDHITGLSTPAGSDADTQQTRSDFAGGHWVRIERAEPARGTWSRYAGRHGRIVAVNSVDAEFGVVFTASGGERPTWFRRNEIISIDTPPKAPRITLRAERNGGRGAQRPPQRRNGLAG